MADKTYCCNAACPYKDCEKHLANIDRTAKYVKIANLDGVCRRYIAYLVEKSADLTQ